MSKKILVLTVALCATLSAVAVACPAGVDVVSYENDVNYLDEMKLAATDGSLYALAMGAIYEKQRNLKIDSEALVIRKTNFFSGNRTGSEILELIDRYTNSDTTPYELSRYERGLVESAVMAEAGGESYEGQMMVAQCILDGSLRNEMSVDAAMQRYQVVTTARTVTDSVKSAVSAVFDYGERVTEEKADLWYAPATCRSSWHEQQIYITTIGAHKFFWMRTGL